MLKAEIFSALTTHDKHIFVRPKKVCLLWEKCLFRGKVLILGSGGFCILGIVYCIYGIDSSIRIGLFGYNRK